MNAYLSVKNIVVALCILGTLIGLFFIHALGGYLSEPIEFDTPPEFVNQYALDRFGENALNLKHDSTEFKLTTDYFNEAALVRNIIVNEESPEALIQLFTHEDKAKRVRIAFAFAEVNSKLSHDEGTQFDDKRDIFWEKVNEHSADIQNALFEALIVSAEESTRTFIPYTLAWWMQEYKPQALKVLLWASRHHPDAWVRNFSVYYVVQFGENEDIAEAMINERIHDPVYRVRKQVLSQRFRILKEGLFGKEE